MSGPTSTYTDAKSIKMVLSCYDVRFGKPHAMLTTKCVQDFASFDSLVDQEDAVLIQQRTVASWPSTYCRGRSPPNQLPLFPLWPVVTGEENPSCTIAHRGPEVTWAVSRGRAEMLAGLLAHRPTGLCEAPAARRFSVLLSSPLSLSQKRRFSVLSGPCIRIALSP
jgi:hypothetical protein